MGSRIDIGTRGRNSTTIGGSAGTPKYVGARAEVTRIPNVGVKIRLTDYKGTTEEVVAEAIESIVTNDNGSLTFTLPDGRTFTTDSLTGPMGPIGPEGPEGEKGDTGETGPQGETGNGIADAELNSDYTLTLDFTDGTSYTTPSIRGATGAQGVQGPQGERGLQGEKGDPGEAFSIVKTYASIAEMNADYSGTDVKIGEYVMITSTIEDPDNAKVYIKGSQAYQFVVDMSGATGVKGDKGDKGETGPQGPQGPQGIQGIQGIQGEKGDTGATGPQGEKGDKGDTGTTDYEDLENKPFIPSLTSDLENDLRFIKAVDMASGEIATFKDAFIKKLTADINPIQDLHGYDKPWAGGNGKNKLFINDSSETKNGITMTANSDGSIKLNGTATAYTFFNLNYVDSDTLSIPVGTYYANGGIDNVTYRVYVDGSRALDNTAIVDREFTVPSGATVSYFRIDISTGSSFNNETFYPMVRLTSETNPAWEPYSNECPIIGWTECVLPRTGINAWDEVWEQGRYNETGQPVTATNSVRSKNYILCKPNTTYYIANGTNSQGRINFFDANKTWIGTATGTNATHTTPSNCFYMLISTDATYGGTYNNDISINYPSTDTAYHAYNGNTYTIDLGGTRYGGTIDVTSGVMNVTHGIKDDATAIRTGTGASGARYADITVTGITQNASTICSHYEQIPVSGTGTIGKFKVFNNEITVYDDRFTSVSAADAILADVQFVYELATPLTVQLTPTQIEALTGENNVWASTGNVELELVGVPEMADKIPFAPTSDGTYTLKVTITDGEAAYSWVADE